MLRAVLVPPLMSPEAAVMVRALPAMDQLLAVSRTQVHSSEGALPSNSSVKPALPVRATV